MNYNEITEEILNNYLNSTNYDSIDLKKILLFCYHNFINNDIFDTSLNTLLINLLQKMFVNKNEILNPNDFLHCCLNNLINNNELIDSDLNTLLFICYKQFLNPNLLTQSLLITILDRFNDIENYKNIYLPWEYLQYNTQDKDLYLRMFANKKILNITNDEIRWN